MESGFSAIFGSRLLLNKLAIPYRTLSRDGDEVYLVSRAGWHWLEAFYDDKTTAKITRQMVKTQRPVLLDNGDEVVRSLEAQGWSFAE